MDQPLAATADPLGKTGTQLLGLHSFAIRLHPTQPILGSGIGPKSVENTADGLVEGKREWNINANGFGDRDVVVLQAITVKFQVKSQNDRNKGSLSYYEVIGYGGGKKALNATDNWNVKVPALDVDEFTGASVTYTGTLIACKLTDALKKELAAKNADGSPVWAPRAYDFMDNGVVTTIPKIDSGTFDSCGDTARIDALLKGNGVELKRENPFTKRVLDWTRRERWHWSD